MQLPTDYADRSSILADIENIEAHWHQDSSDAKLGKIAAIVVLVSILTLSIVTYAAQPAATPKHAHKMAVSHMSLVDDKGGE